MKFHNVLKEYVLNIPLKVWNEKQKVLWYQVIQKENLDKNDWQKFRKFAELFDNFYKKNKKFPKVNDIKM